MRRIDNKLQQVTLNCLISFQFPRSEVTVVVQAERADREGALAHAAVHQHPGHLLRPGHKLRTREFLKLPDIAGVD